MCTRRTRRDGSRRRGRLHHLPHHPGQPDGLLVREGQSAEVARSVPQELADHPRHEFWPDTASCHDMRVSGIIGHRQVTEAYLAHLARSYSARLATFDEALAKLHADVADLIPAAPSSPPSSGQFTEPGCRG